MSVAAILPLVLQALKLAPGFIQTGGEIIEGAQKIWNGVTAEQPPTPDQQAEYDRALQEAHDALQRS